MHIFRRSFAATIALLSHAASAQISGASPGGPSVPHVGIFCVNSAGNDVVCSFGSGGGGGAITAAAGSFAAGSIVDGANLTLGSKTDAAWGGSGSGSEIAILKSVWTELSGNLSIGNFPATQAVSLASLPSLAAGSAAIGSVTVSSLPSVTLGAGAAAIGSVTISNTPTVTLGVGGVIIGMVRNAGTYLYADVASSALTSSATTSGLAFAYGLAYQVSVPVTAISGTSPTLDIEVQESEDNVNGYPVYDLPRLTGVGIVRTPPLPVTGGYRRYVQTVGGTSPSFTRAINVTLSGNVPRLLRQTIDRSIVLTTAGSATASTSSADAGGAINVMISGLAFSAAPTLALQGSDDGGLTWSQIGNTFTPTAGTSSYAFSGYPFGQLRVAVATAGTAATCNYVAIKVAG